MSRRRSNVAFSLIELLVVISIIALLISLLLPALGAAKELTKQIKCRSNLHQLSTAWFNYSSEHDGRLVYGVPNDEKGFVQKGPGTEPIEGGKLYPYCPNFELWKCPSDPYRLERSVSIVGSMHGEGWDRPKGAWPSIGTNKFEAILNPVDQLVFMEESDRRGWNRGSWVMHVESARKWRWIDYVAVFHKSGANLGMADGHVEFRQWEDEDTIRTAIAQDFYLDDPDSEDWLVIRNKYRQLAGGPGIPAYEE